MSVDMIRDLRRLCPRVLNYNCDDPTGPRDGMRWRTFRRAISEYDLCAVLRSQNVAEYPRFGARALLQVWHSTDEVAHAPREITPEIKARWASEVSFVGTWMPERGPFMARLLKLGVPLTLRGIRWPKSREWNVLKSAWKGAELVGDEYAYAIQCAKVNIGMLSKGNRDLHTQRSGEIPALGALFCAERTEEHRQLYEESKEALFWDNADECARHCLQILGNPDRGLKIAAAGRKRWLVGPMRNEVIVGSILDRLKRPTFSAAL
jgi:hypothetical protein